MKIAKGSLLKEDNKVLPPKSVADVCKKRRRSDIRNVLKMFDEVNPIIRFVFRTNQTKRFAFKNSIGRSDLPSIARSARISPTTEANLKPWPLKPQAIETFSS